MNKNENNKPLYIMLVATVLLVLGASVAYGMNRGGEEKDESGTDYTNFAQCITDSGAKFYGAYWCPHCQDQKEAFGNAIDLVPYVECSTQDNRDQTEACAEAGITVYPTWIFGNGAELTGNIALTSLAEITGCEMPVE